MVISSEQGGGLKPMRSRKLKLTSMGSCILEDAIPLEVADLEKNNEKFMTGLKKQAKTLISQRPKRQQLFYLFHLILNQRKFSYHDCNALTYFLRCFCLRKQSSLKKLASAKQDVLLNKGTEKLERDLDIVELLDIIHGFRVMKKTLFTKDERYLMHF